MEMMMQIFAWTDEDGCNEWVSVADAEFVPSDAVAHVRADVHQAALDRIARLEAAPFPDVDGFYGLIGDAVREAENAMRKFPQPNYIISKVAEEAGEVVKAAIHCAEGRETAENLRGEMKQAIAMLYRLWVEGDQVHGLPPVRPAARQGGRDEG